MGSQTIWHLAAFLLLSILCQPGMAGNPVVQTVYTADPAPLVHDGRVWLFTGHDEDNFTNFDMGDWHLFSTNDMANWQHHGVVMSLDTGKIRYGNMAIGVAVADKITGPYSDALGRPLVENGEIDPAIFIDDDRQAYMYWRNPNLYYVLLNEDMISYSGEVVQVELTPASFGLRTNHPARETMYEEGPWLYKRSNLNYIIFAADYCQENLQYSTGPSATGPWTYQGILMDRQGSSFTNHAGVVHYQDQDYLFYHNGALPGGGGFTRSVCVEALAYGSNGQIQQIYMTEDGPPQIQSLDPYARQEAETFAWGQGVETETSADGTLNLWSINNGDYIKVKGVDFGTGAATLTARVASEQKGGFLELHIDNRDGQLISTCEIPVTGGWQTYVTVSCDVAFASGLHDLFFVFKGEGDLDLFTFDWWQFKAI